MAPDDVMSTPIFDELLRELTQPEKSPTPPATKSSSSPKPPAAPKPPARRRHRAE